MKFSLDKGAFAPVKAHYADAGIDLRCMNDFTVLAGYSQCIATGVHVQIPEGYVGMIKTKSGINVKRNCTTEGVIDSGYTGQIIVKMYNHGTDDQDFYAGDKIAQLVIMPIELVELEEVTTEELIQTTTSSTRGDAGFGSTGR